MNFFRSLYRWGYLYVLVGFLVGVIFWEENLNITPGEHKLLAIAVLICFGFIINRWISRHETNFLVSQFYAPQSNQKMLRRELENDNFKE
jgi:hypothetical protein